MKKETKKESIKPSLPNHLGIIMDGNGRWAKKRGLPRKAGHLSGAKVVKTIVRYCAEIGIEYLTIYAFSTENWKRSEDEVSSLIQLLRRYLTELESYIKDNCIIRFIGDLTAFDPDIREHIREIEDASKVNTGMTFSIAINYGGRDEIRHATQEIAKKVKNGEISPEEITEKTVEEHLYTKGIPNVDCIIRPSGEYRLSNFLVWQSAYAEFIFMDDILWPDFKPKHLDMALTEYSKRNRRFGAAT